MNWDDSSRITIIWNSHRGNKEIRGKENTVSTFISQIAAQLHS